MALAERLGAAHGAARPDGEDGGSSRGAALEGGRLVGRAFSEDVAHEAPVRIRRHHGPSEPAALLARALGMAERVAERVAAVGRILGDLRDLVEAAARRPRVERPSEDGARQPAGERRHRRRLSAQGWRAEARAEGW